MSFGKFEKDDSGPAIRKFCGGAIGLGMGDCIGVGGGAFGDRIADYC